MTLDEQDEIARPFGGSHKQSQGAGDALISEDDGNSFGSSVCESNSDEIKLSNEFSELKEQLREFKVELQKKKNEVKYLNEEKAYLEVQIKKVQDENSQLKTEVEELNKEKDGLYKQINQLNDKIAQLQNEISKSIDENACLKEKICKLEDNLERDTQIIKEQRVEIEEQRIEIKDFERENRRLKNKIKLQRLPIILCVVLGIATIVFGVLFANHVRLNNNKKREIVRLEQLSDSLQIIVDMKSNSVANDEEIQNLKGANKALQKVNDSLNKIVSERPNDTNPDIEVLIEQLNKAKSEIERLKEKITSQDENIERIKKDKSALNDTIIKLKIDIKEKNAVLGAAGLLK